MFIKMKIILPESVNFIISTLQKNGFEAYAVGGCIRDSILNKIPKDWDITTSASPKDIINLFNKTVPTGLKHGTVTVLIDKIQYEVTTFRIDGKYTDNRHPDDVVFTTSLYEDLKRRDFTMNALAFNYIDGLIDPFNGKTDILNGVVRCVGTPDLRFREDALRLLRAIRFSCELNFKIDKPTFDSITRNFTLIKKISIERVRDEFSKILLSKTPSSGIRLLNKANLLNSIMPELSLCIGFDQHNPHHDKDVFDHTMLVLDNTKETLILRLAGLLHDIGKPECFTLDIKGIGHFYNHYKVSFEISKEILGRLKYDNYTTETTCMLIYEHMIVGNKMKDASVKRFVSRVGVPNLPLLFNLLEADLKGHKPPHDFSRIQSLKASIYEILEKNEPFSLKQLAINGSDLIDLGYVKGPKIGFVLDELLELVLQTPNLNTRESLLDIARTKVSKKNS
jgi:tRNA nucleotidyltransferase (CCA-adding enzyme)